MLACVIVGRRIDGIKQNEYAEQGVWRRPFVITSFEVCLSSEGRLSVGF